MNEGFSFHDDGIYSGKTYGGLLEGKPTRKMADDEISSLKKIAESFCWMKPYVYLGNTDIENKPLPPRGNAAWVTSYKTIKNDNGCFCGSHALIIWFDDFKLDVRAGLKKIMEEIDWEKVAENFDY